LPTKIIQPNSGESLAESGLTKKMFSTMLCPDITETISKIVHTINTRPIVSDCIDLQKHCFKQKFNIDFHHFYQNFSCKKYKNKRNQSLYKKKIQKFNKAILL
jgi:hypothetical protein